MSVVVIFRDEERFITEAIDSVFAQTYPHWELLLVDDGSADASPALARQVAEREASRVRYLQHPGGVNRGMSASRNLGIRHARGAYLAFLDADDTWLATKLAEQVAVLNEQPGAAMVYGATQWWYSWTGHAEDSGRDFVHPLGVAADVPLPPPVVVTQMLRHEGTSPCTCSILVRRDVVQRVGAFEESFKSLYEDQAFCAKVCLSYPVVASSQCWYRYRQHPDSACAVAGRTGADRVARRDFLGWLEGYLVQNEIKYPDVWAALRHEQWCSRHPRLEDGLERARRLARRVTSMVSA